MHNDDACRKREPPLGPAASAKHVLQAHERIWRISLLPRRPLQRMAEMMADRGFPTRPGNRVDWSEPQLQKLLNKIEGWDLDNRESYAREEVQIQVGWSAGSVRAATLVWKREKVMVLEASFPIPTGEFVRVDTFLGDGMRSVWGVVVEGRAGRRAEDCSNGVNVYWLHEC